MNITELLLGVVEVSSVRFQQRLKSQNSLRHRVGVLRRVGVAAITVVELFENGRRGRDS